MIEQIKKPLALIAARAGLNVESHSERTAALAAAEAEVDQAAERDRYHRQREAADAAKMIESTREALRARAEDQRRACASALLGEALDAKDPKSLSSLIAAWRSEPTRQLTLAIQARWAELNARAQAKLGAELGTHVLAVPFVEAISASVPGAINYLGDHVGAHGVIDALTAFVRAAAPTEALTALEQLEAALLAAGRRGAGEAVNPVSVQRHELRRVHATRADLMAASAALEEVHRKAELETFGQTYKAPPLNPPSLVTRVSEWLSA